MTEKLFLTDCYLKDFTARVTDVTPAGIVLDRTAFYATSGGQPGDTGTLDGVAVTDTVKDRENPDRIIHIVSPDNLSRFTVGQNVAGTIDWDRRYRHMRFHTMLHLVCKLIDGYATGNQISTDKARIDFDVAIADLHKDALTAQLNTLIADGYPVTFSTVEEAELDRNPALVRTLSVQPPRGTGSLRMITIGDADAPVDRQPCGGTHVRNTAEIGPVTITKIENKGKQNKRIIIVLNDTPSQMAA